MPDREKVIEGLKCCANGCLGDCSYFKVDECGQLLSKEALELLKEHKSEYENGFNDAMLGKKELMYEGTDGKWHKKDW